VCCFCWTVARTIQNSIYRSAGFVLFATPFAVTMESVAIHLQMKLIDMQCNIDLKTKFTEVVIVKFYEQHVPTNQFPGLMHQA